MVMVMVKVKVMVDVEVKASVKVHVEITVKANVKVEVKVKESGSECAVDHAPMLSVSAVNYMRSMAASFADGHSFVSDVSPLRASIAALLVSSNDITRYSFLWMT